MRVASIIFIFTCLFVAGRVSAQSNLVSDDVEFQALKAFWEHTNGASWTTKTNWPTAGSWPSTATATVMDTWHGVVVTNGDITELLLNGNNVGGVLPKELGDLKELKKLQLYDNNIYGPLPIRLGECTKLTQMLVYNNKINGSIPDNFSSLTALQFMYLHTNRLTGPIPSTLSSLTNLVHFDVHGNQMIGTVPPIFSSMTQLVTLNIGYNKFTGTLPTLRGLYITVSTNSFTGDFPAVSGAVSSIDASFNGFTGIAMSFSGQTGMSVINMANNELVSLPSSLLTKPNRMICQLLVANNRLDYATLEPYTTAGFNSSSNFVSQKPIIDVTQKAIAHGSPFTLTARPLGANTTLTWEKLSGSTWTAVGNDQDAVAQTYTRNSAAASDEGTYRWKTTSTSFGGSIQSDPIEVKSVVRYAVDNWGFQYRYDARKRMTHKKVPGADWVYMVYDNRDRLVYTQDGNQRANGLWSFTKYDQLNRPVLTGIKDTTSITQQAMQAVVDHFYTAASAKWGESTGGTIHGYTNLSYPKMTDPQKYLTANYYDDYSWIAGLYDNTRLNFVNTHIGGQPSTNFAYVTGMPTGTKVKVLDGGTWGATTWLSSVTYYDDKQRVIQTVSDNYKGGTERTTNVLDFVGRVTKTKTTHEDYDVTWTNLVAVNTLGNKVVSTQSVDGWGGSGLASVEKLPAMTDGWIEVTMNEALVSPGVYTRWIVGLSTTNPNADVTSIQYGIGMYTNWLTTNHSTSMLNHTTGVSRGEVLKITRTGSIVRFYRNGTHFHSVTGASTGELMIDAALYYNNASFVNVRASFAKKMDSVMRWFDYDHAGRLTKTWHKVNNGEKILLSSNDYNEIGQLVDKKLHSSDNGVTGEQSIDYRYNIRGWLTSINGSELNASEVNSESSSQKRDLFGMDLLYNATDSGLGNTSLFNGNISAMKWSSNLGIGEVKQNAFTYGYDAMNRLTSAGFQQKNNEWQTNTTNAFSESGYTYDLNGNIKTLTRRGLGGETMDDLSYDYGSTETTRSNRLLKVADSGDKLKGFVDGVNLDNDYGYDANGNMIFDQNKKMTATANIAYNHLNLPELVNRAGARLYYAYDATGRKLSQTALFTAVGTKRTDYVGEFEYENDQLASANTEEGRVVFSEREEVYTHSGDLSEVTAVNASADTVRIDGEKYLRVVARSTASGTGLFPIGDGIAVSAGERYLLRAKGYQTLGATAYIHAKVNGTTVDWPKTALPRNGVATWAEQVITIPSGGTLLQIGLTWSPGVLGETYHLNELEVIKMTATQAEYQYHLKDHLGNVRMTFTTKDEVDEVSASLETDSANVDRANFLRYDLAKRVKSFLFDHTKDNDTDSVGYAQRLNGSEDERIGLSKSLSVMPGDTIRAEVYAKYVDFDDNNWQAALQTLMGYLGSPGTAPPGTIVDGSGYVNSNTTPLGITPLGHGTDDENGVPKAYLNYIFINRNFDISSLKVRYKRITQAGKEDGSDGPHDYLTLGDTIEEAGYVYVYLSNDGEEEREVYFDDFKVEHVKSPVIQSEDFYPFGLTFNSYNRENALNNQYQYNGKEEQDELSLGWLDYGQRMYQPELGRFFSQDRFASKYFDTSPYSYGANNPALYVDINGDSVWTTHNSVTDKNGNTTITHTINITGKVLKQSSGNTSARGLAAGLNSRLNAQGSTTTKKNADGSTTTEITKMNANYQAASSMDDVSSSDHLVVITDGVLGSGDPKLSDGGGGAAGLGMLGGQVSIVEDTDAVETAFHEVGHNLGLPHPDSNSGDPMSYTGRGGNFSPAQMDQILNNAIYGVPNRGSNSGTMGTLFPNVKQGTFYGHSDNTRPFRGMAPDSRARVPLPLINVYK